MSKREYEPVNWVDSRFDRHGYFRLERPTIDRSTAADDPAYSKTDFLNYNINRQNIWEEWFQKDANGKILRDDRHRALPLPYRDRKVRPVVWYTTSEM